MMTMKSQCGHLSMQDRVKREQLQCSEQRKICIKKKQQQPACAHTKKEQAITKI